MSELFPRTLFESDDVEVPETKARRLMELRLAQNSLLNVNPPSSQSTQSPEWLHKWRDILPKFMLIHDCVLYASHALSATHLLRTSRDDEALYNARQNYLVLALREQRKQVSNINTENADAVCLTSMLILLTSFAMMQERDLSIYTPPVEWLKMGRGARAVVWKARNAIPPNFPAVFKSFVIAHSALGMDQILQSELEPTFATLYHTMCDHEGWDMETQAIYRRTLAYISTVQRSLNDKEKSFELGRQIQAFPMVIPSGFADLVERQDACALLVLAHYFGVVAQTPDEFWWRKGEDEHNGTAKREILAIHNFIPREWRALMQWPLSKVNG
ncbi:hypothetical protein H2198_003170 [Neophaeococcomyces mojaviensis]|uniref:Uncharacterized protein n=1 Tax=Neophaeococcomyces mojaviensis TaxID=3383035 RepID=A0ACC3ABY9_9EURO|nr:hypothetical protein H2198_003170 [Knufia sp. JES_112]